MTPFRFPYVVRPEVLSVSFLKLEVDRYSKTKIKKVNEGMNQSINQTSSRQTRLTWLSHS